MNAFINREEERRIIEESIQSLSNYRRNALRTPIISFHGISGIGKTSIVQHIGNMCKVQNIHYLHVTTPKDAQDFSRDIIRQVKRYGIFFDEYPDEQLLTHSVTALKDLLKQNVVVMLLDAVDTANRELVERIAITLREVINENKLFVVLTSRKVLAFESERIVARNLTPLALKPFDQKSCDDYLDRVGIPTDREIRKYIYSWTQGYPLAIEVMTKAIMQKALDPRIIANQQPLMNLIFRHVIEEKVLARIKPSMRNKYQPMLLLLSIPRRFNLVIMQELIERFELNQKYESSLSYINLSKEMIRETGIMSWNRLKGGFSVETPIRHIYLLKNQIEREELYLEIHRFLTELNQNIATTMSGTDYIWYTREYLYHSTFCVDAQQMRQILKQALQHIFQEPPELLEQFYEEFEQDKELQEHLGPEQVDLVHFLLYQHLAHVNLHLARQTADTERLDHLCDFFYFTLSNPYLDDHHSEMRQILHTIISENPPAFPRQQLLMLAQEERFVNTLGQYAAIFITSIQEIVEEG